MDSLGEGLFQIVQSIGQRFLFRFADEQVNVFGHDHVSVDTNGKAEARSFETIEEEVVDYGGGELGLSADATESHEVGLPGFLKAN